MRLTPCTADDVRPASKAGAHRLAELATELLLRPAARPRPDPAGRGRRAVRVRARPPSPLDVVLQEQVAARRAVPRRCCCSPRICWPPGTTPSAGSTRFDAGVLGPLAGGRDPAASGSPTGPSGEPRPGAWMDVPVVDVLILEGVSSGRAALGDRAGVSVWLKVPAAATAGTRRRPGRRVVPGPADGLAGRRGRLLRAGPTVGIEPISCASPGQPPPLVRTDHGARSRRMTSFAGRGRGQTCTAVTEGKSYRLA